MPGLGPTVVDYASHDTYGKDMLTSKTKSNNFHVMANSKSAKTSIGNEEEKY